MLSLWPKPSERCRPPADGADGDYEAFADRAESFDSTVSNLSLSIVQSLLQLSRQDAALSSLLLQLLLEAADTSFLRGESLGHLSVFYIYVLQLPTINAQSCWKL